MNWLKKYGDLFFIVMTLLYGLTRNPGAPWKITDTLIVVALVLMALNRVLRMIKR